MLSIIIVENNEGKEFVHKMLEQAKALSQKKEVIFVTNVDYSEFYRKYRIDDFMRWFPVSVVGNIKTAGAGKNVGAQTAVGTDLLFMDCHVCYDQANVNRLLKTLDKHPDAIVAPGSQVIEFPSCKISGGTGYGVAYSFKNYPFEWKWLPIEKSNEEYPVPIVCGCHFSMKKELFNIFNGYGGFIQPEHGEEKSIRLWRLGHPTLIEPRATFGHYFKGQPGHKNQERSFADGWHISNAIALYVNVFDPQLWNYLDNKLKSSWGDQWTKSLQYAKDNYGWLRAMMQPKAKAIDERWFFRTE